MGELKQLEDQDVAQQEELDTDYRDVDQAYFEQQLTVEVVVPILLTLATT